MASSGMDCRLSLVSTNSPYANTSSRVLPQGSQRDHFLSHATIDAVAEGRKKDPEMFKPACYNAKVSPALNYHPSAAWTWAVCQDERPPMILFTDV